MSSEVLSGLLAFDMTDMEALKKSLSRCENHPCSTGHRAG